MTQSSLLQEIEEDMQRQKLEAMWKNYGKFIVGLALFVVLATAAITSWKSWHTQKQQKATAELLSLVESKELDTDKKFAALENFARVHHGEAHGSLAQLQAAALEVKDGKLDKALAVYDALAKDDKAAKIFRQLADVLAVQVQLDNGDPAKLQARLQPLLKDSAWKNTAMELSAHLALRAGDKEKAKQLFTDLTKDANTPQAMAQRSADMLRWLDGGS